MTASLGQYDGDIISCRRTNSFLEVNVTTYTVPSLVHLAGIRRSTTVAGTFWTLWNSREQKTGWWHLHFFSSTRAAYPVSDDTACSSLETTIINHRCTTLATSTTKIKDKWVNECIVEDFQSFVLFAWQPIYITCCTFFVIWKKKPSCFSVCFCERHPDFILWVSFKLTCILLLKMTSSDRCL